MWNMLIPMAAGALMGKSNYDAKQAQQKRTGQAAADAQAASWARKNGQGSIPEIQWNNASELGSVAGGALSGASFGQQFGDAFAPDSAATDWMGLKQKYGYGTPSEAEYMKKQGNLIAK